MALQIESALRYSESPTYKHSMFKLSKIRTRAFVHIQSRTLIHKFGERVQCASSESAVEAQTEASVKAAEMKLVLLRSAHR